MIRFVTAELPTVPVAFWTVHVCTGVDGCDETVTRYVAPLATGVGKLKFPFVLVVNVSVPLFWSERDSPGARPLIVPPRANVFVVQVTLTVPTAPLPTLPEPWATLHVC